LLAIADTFLLGFGLATQPPCGEAFSQLESGCDYVTIISCDEEEAPVNIRTIEYSYVIIGNAMPDSLRRFKADVFQALAHPTRIAIIELLGNRELSAGELIGELGMEQANVSQHLAVLRSRQLVMNRKAGNQVFYSIRDPILLEVLGLMRSYFQKHLTEALALLEEVGESQMENGK
jgi:DNA-binding transcriptional ArsR family regulator